MVAPNITAEDAGERGGLFYFALNITAEDAEDAEGFSTLPLVHTLRCFLQNIVG